MFKKYPPESVGSVMTDKVPLISLEQTVKEVKEILKNNNFSTINYLYIINQDYQLIGVLSIKELFSKNDQELITINPNKDREKAVLLAIKNSLKAVPVVDKNNVFLGVVTSDMILDILQKENIEDLLLAGGIAVTNKSIEEFLKVKTLMMVKLRIPWLLVGLIGGVLAAQIISSFEMVLSSFIALTFFIPIIVYLADAVSTQTATIFIRGVAFTNSVFIKKYFLKELKIGSFLGLILGSILSLVAYFWQKDYTLSIIIFFSIFLGVLFSVIFAILFPLLLKKTKKDPAIGTNPIVTILSDVTAITIYLLIAMLLLNLTKT